MIKDIKTILWKEYKELFSRHGNVRRNLHGILLFTVVLGLYFPWVAGPEFVKAPVVLLFYIFFPLIMTLSMMIDSFAGERERHTLETLLASRLPDAAIVVGKTFSVVLYGVGATLAFVILGLAVVNVAYWDGHILVFEPDLLLLVLLAALTVHILLASLGIVISIKAPTVRVGGDVLVGGLLAVATAIYALYSIVPEGWKAGVASLALSTGRTNLEIALAVAFGAICLAALYVAVKLFRRDRLMLV